jgi:lipopolysaccharide transport system ATP-binding protein
MTPAVRIEQLSKEYRLGLGVVGSYHTLRESIMETICSPWRRLSRPTVGSKQSPRTHWALRDVTLDISPGAVVGIIGRNGAGKSTLLKILSRITEPTAGRVELRGRVGSLLEVGTGFHQELTGRENIYLNGAILGMTRREITRKFDAIVAFAEIEPFLDTPVKRYSSGMYVRLAFAVASHLEPEILVIDEVLAVGDQAFQRKCLGRMNEVRRSGRTVLFVSHHLAAIQHLCDSVAVLERGELTFAGEVSAGIELYSQSCRSEAGAEVDLLLLPHQASGDRRLLRRLRILDRQNQPTDQIRCGELVRFEVTIDPCGGPDELNCAILVEDSFGGRMFTVGTFHVRGLATLHGPRRLVCSIEDLPLAPGRYALTLLAGPMHHLRSDVVEHAAWLHVTDADFYGNGKPPEPGRGKFLVRSHWEAQAK